MGHLKSGWLQRFSHRHCLRKHGMVVDKGNSPCNDLFTWKVEDRRYISMHTDSSIHLLISRGAILNIKFMTCSRKVTCHLGLISLSWIHVFSSGAIGILWQVTFLLQLLLNKSPYKLLEGTAQLRPFEPNKKVVFSVLSRVIFIQGAKKDTDFLWLLLLSSCSQNAIVCVSK